MKAPAYFDTSVLVKRYINESGADEARRHLRESEICTSSVSLVEGVSAFRQKLGMGEINKADFDEFLGRFQRDRELFELAGVTDDVLQHAESLAARSDVRALDAIHIASALVMQALSGIRLPFITADVRQHAAALATGLDAVFIGGK